MLYRAKTALYMSKNVADKIANADYAKNFRLWEYLSLKIDSFFELASLDSPDSRM